MHTTLKNPFAATALTPIFVKITLLMKVSSRSIIFAVVLVAVTTLVKFICAPVLGLSGFTTIIAVALFAGMSAKEKNTSFLLPLVALFLSDVIIEILYKSDLFAFPGFYKHQITNYALLLVAPLIGWMIKAKNVASIALASFAAPTVFFLCSNFTVWLGSTTMYTKDLSGLINCYEMGLPFYRNALISTFVFVPALLFVYNYLVKAKTEIVLA
jgi:hypothetical protein